MSVSKVHNIDCVEYLRSIPDRFFDLAIVDPPYGLPKNSSYGSGKSYKKWYAEKYLQQKIDFEEEK